MCLHPVLMIILNLASASSIQKLDQILPAASSHIYDMIKPAATKRAPLAANILSK